MVDLKVIKVLDEALRRSLEKGFPKVEISVLLDVIFEQPDNLFYKFIDENLLIDEEVKQCLADIIEAESIRDAGKEAEEIISLTVDSRSIPVDDRLINVLVYEETYLDVNGLFEEIIYLEPYCLVELLRQLDVEYKSLVDFVEKRVKEVKGIIPEYMEGILTLKNLEIQEGNPKRILGRDEEMHNIWHILSKKTKSNVILVGEPGVGKTAIAELMVYEIVNHKCPKQFEGYQVIQLNVNDLIAGTMYRGQAEERFAEIKELLENNKNIILFIDEIHMMLGAGSGEGNTLDFANSMKPLLASDKGKVVGATTFEEYEWFAQDGALARRFEKVEVREPRHSEVYPMIKGKVEELKEYHGVTMSKKMVDYIILQASCFYNNIANPDRSLDFVDKAMAAAKIRGAKVVSKTDINKVLDVNLKAYQKMSIEDKTATAYHEAGHCMLVNLSKLNKVYDMIALSIMPTNEYLGLTVYDKKEESFGMSWTKELFVEQIAVSLAGRVAEKEYTKKLSAGASIDLINANELAREMITSYSMGENSDNRIYYLEDLWSAKTNNNINKEIKKILVKAEQRAEEIIYANQTLLKALVEALVEKGILNKKELDTIFAAHSVTKCKVK